MVVLGLAMVVTAAAVAISRARQRRELTRQKGELDTETQLENYLSRLDQAKTDEDIDRLGDHTERKDSG